MTASLTQEFSATVTPKGTSLQIELPFLPADVWGPRDRYHISGTVNGVPIRGALLHSQGAYYLRMGPAWLNASGVYAQMKVKVVLTVEGPQVASQPDDIAAAFAKHPAAQTFFDSLPTYYRKNYMRWIESAKRPETRAKRLAEMMDLLNHGKREH
ncbi:MAG: YdeI/OmpD-associated family protein [Roseiflexaceae bacterium]|jgi:hypothetical protein